jgi:hypothetical protein
MEEKEINDRCFAINPSYGHFPANVQFRIDSGFAPVILNPPLEFCQLGELSQNASQSREWMGTLM